MGLGLTHMIHYFGHRVFRYSLLLSWCHAFECLELRRAK